MKLPAFLGGRRSKSSATPASDKGKLPFVAERLPEVAYNDNPIIERLVFICGLHRSGTTLLERMLTSQYEVSYLRATVPESEGQHMQSVYAAGLEFGGAGLFAFSQDMQRQLSDLLSDPKECRERILKEWSRFVVGDSATLIEKSPPNLTKIDWLRSVFPGSRFVIMTRDPRAAAGATRKWSHTPLSDLMRHWDRAHAIALQEMRDEDCATIRYEDLCDDPQGEIERIATFLDLTERDRSQQLEERHASLTNSNAKYLKMHGTTRYGAGAWQNFGYAV
ncbi:MAG: sulfotransferase [Pseudomonadota bacterium]